jgi:hypothetical protein
MKLLLLLFFFFFLSEKIMKQLSFLIDYYLRRSGKLDRLVTDGVQ